MRYRAGGVQALQHGRCGRLLNRAYTAEFRVAALKQVQMRYEDFGPTLAAEHLASGRTRPWPELIITGGGPPRGSWTKSSGWRRNGW